MRHWGRSLWLAFIWMRTWPISPLHYVMPGTRYSLREKEALANQTLGIFNEPLPNAAFSLHLARVTFATPSTLDFIEALSGDVY